DLFAHFGGEFVRGDWAALRERLMDREPKVRHLQSSGGGGRLLPRLVSAQGEDVGEDSSGGNEVGCVAGRAGMDRRGTRTKQVQRYGQAIRDQAGQRSEERRVGKEGRSR